MKIQNSKFKIQSYNLKFKTIGFLSLTFIFSLLNFNLSGASAQEAVRTLSIVPPGIEVSLSPGGRTEGTMKVINDSTSPLSFSVSVQDYIVTDSMGTPNILPPNTLNNKYSGASWIAVYPQTFTVQPGQRQDLSYFLQTPADASAGGHYAAVVFTPLNPSGVSGTGAEVQTQVGSLFYIQVEGDIREQATVTKFEAEGFKETTPVKITTQIKNDGDLHIRPKGSITISNMFGREVSKLPLEEKNIFPGGAVRDYENEFEGGLSIGRYKATLLAGYGLTGALPLSATVYFWVFPWRAALIITLAAVAVILLVLYLRRKKNKKEEDQKPTQYPL